MNIQHQIAQLESLLARIRRNASVPRAASMRSAAVPAEPEAPSVEAPPESGPATDRTDVLGDHPTAPPAARVSEPPVAASAEVEELDMADAEIVEIAAEASSDEAQEEELVAAASPLGSDALDSAEEEPPAPLANEVVEEEPAPESAPRPAAQAAEEADLEPPVKTPPPESGRQVVGTPVAIAGETVLHETGSVASIEPDLSGGTISQAPAGEPSLAQLGETVELEGADGPPARIELLSPPMSVPGPEPELPSDDLELSLPQRQYGGGYDADLAPPSRAGEDLARHRGQAAAPPVADLAPEAPASPLVVARPALGDLQVTEMRRAAAPELPDTFLALLDGSLSIEA